MRKLVVVALVLVCALGGRLHGAADDCGDASPSPWLVEPLPGAAAAGVPMGPPLRVLTYNIHSGLGSHFALRASRARVTANLEAIADAIASASGGGEPVDVVGLNEVDFAARRSAWIDEADYLADALERRTGARFAVLRGETWRRTTPGFEVRFGNAALVRRPIVRAETCLFDRLDPCAAPSADGALPALVATSWLGRLLREPRGVIRLTIDVDGAPVDVLVTHLDALVMSEREAQAAHLLHRLVTPGRTTVVLGDMNAVPYVLTRARRFFTADTTHDLLADGALSDARLAYAAIHRRPTLADWATFPATHPAWALDWVFGSPELAPVAVRTVGPGASDHLGLFVEYDRLREPAALADYRRLHDHLRAAVLTHGRCGGLRAAAAHDAPA